jgi:hypothetical protein
VPSPVERESLGTREIPAAGHGQPGSIAAGDRSDAARQRAEAGAMGWDLYVALRDRFPTANLTLLNDIAWFVADDFPARARQPTRWQVGTHERVTHPRPVVASRGRVHPGDVGQL